MTGKILRFDEMRGYGFIVPDEGDEDVFMHANDLVEEKYLYQPGREVEFFVEMGDKGPKASQIRFVRRATSGAVPSSPEMIAPRPQSPQASDDTLCDVLSVAELRNELTEALLESDETLTAVQIKRIRARLIQLAQAHSWTDV